MDTSWGGEATSDFEYESDACFTGFQHGKEGSDSPQRVMKLKTPPPVNIADAYWICRGCTFHENPADRDTCIVCSQAKADTNGKSDGPAQVEVVEEIFEASWACSTCTLLNSTTSVKCKACGTKLFRSFHEMLAGKETTSPKPVIRRSEKRIRTHASAAVSVSSSSEDEFYVNSVNAYFNSLENLAKPIKSPPQTVAVQRDSNKRPRSAVASPAVKSSPRYTKRARHSSSASEDEESFISSSSDASLSEYESSEEDEGADTDASSLQQASASSAVEDTSSEREESSDSEESNESEESSVGEHRRRKRASKRDRRRRSPSTRSDSASLPIKRLTEDELQALRTKRLEQLLQQTTAIMQELHQRVEQRVISQPAASTGGSLTCLSPPKRRLEEADTAPLKLTQPSAITATLHDYQIDGITWLRRLHDAGLAGILADEMGLGKTLQVLSFLLHLHEESQVNGPHLIICPLSVLHSWTTDIAKFIPGMEDTVHVYRGEKHERARELRRFLRGKRSTTAFPILVLTTYDMVLRDPGSFQSLHWEYIVVDEGHRLKNSHAKLAKILRKCDSSHRLLLTGTPLQNNLTELWSLLNFCLPQLFNSADNFLRWFASPFDNVVCVKGGNVVEYSVSLSEEEEKAIVGRLQTVLKPFILRRMKHDVLSSLPQKSEVVLLCPLSAMQAAMYERTRLGLREYIDPSTGRVQRHFSVNNAVMRLRQISNHPYLLANEWQLNGDVIRSSGKFEILHRILPKLIAAEHSVLIFSQMTTILDLIEDLLDILGIERVRLDGTVKAEDRDRALSTFTSRSSDGPRVFLLSTRAGGVGLNLQTADTVILFDSDWNPQQDLQAQARAHRIGQLKTVHVIRLLARGPPHLSEKKHKRRGEEWMFSKGVEELMYLRALQKLKTEHTVLGSGHFKHGGADKHADKKSAVMQEMLQSIMAQSAASSDADGFVVGFSGEVEIAAPYHSREMFDTVPNEAINAFISRSPEDLQLMQKWDSHLAAALREKKLHYLYELEENNICDCGCGLNPARFASSTCCEESPGGTANTTSMLSPSKRKTRVTAASDVVLPAVIQPSELPEDLKMYVP